MNPGVNIRWSKIREILFCRVFHLILRLCHVLTIHRRCPTNCRQWANFLACHKAHTKVLKLSAACEHLLVECSKLGKTRIIADGKHGRIRNSVFCAPNVHAPGLIWNVVLSDFFSVIYDIAVRSRDSLIFWRHRQHPGICCADILPCDWLFSENYVVWSKTKVR